MNDYIPLNQNNENTPKQSIQTDPQDSNALAIINEVLNPDQDSQYVPNEEPETTFYPVSPVEVKNQQADSLLSGVWGFVWDNRGKITVAVIGALIGRFIASKLIK